MEVKAQKSQDHNPVQLRIFQRTCSPGRGIGQLWRAHQRPCFAPEKHGGRRRHRMREGCSESTQSSCKEQEPQENDDPESS